MKLITLIFLVAGSVFLLRPERSFAAEMGCYIWIAGKCRASSSIKPYTSFKDYDKSANLNAGRCVQRAQEYKTWCATPGLEVVTAFNVDGRNVIGAITGRDGKTHLTDGLTNGQGLGFTN